MVYVASCLFDSNTEQEAWMQVPSVWQQAWYLRTLGGCPKSWWGMKGLRVQVILSSTFSFDMNPVFKEVSKHSCLSFPRSELRIRQCTHQPHRDTVSSYSNGWMLGGQPQQKGFEARSLADGSLQQGNSWTCCKKLCFTFFDLRWTIPDDSHYAG